MSEKLFRDMVFIMWDLQLVLGLTSVSWGRCHLLHFSSGGVHLGCPTGILPAVLVGLLGFLVGWNP